MARVIMIDLIIISDQPSHVIASQKERMRNTSLSVKDVYSKEQTYFKLHVNFSVLFL